jgi:hypothetical protein
MTIFRYNLRNAISLLVLSLLLGSCSHHMDVRAGAGGIHRVKAQDNSEKEASRNAIRQANHFCKESNKYAVVIEEKISYVGSMNEQTYNNLRTASNAATAVGIGSSIVATTINDKKTLATIGGLATAGGIVGRQILVDGYSADMTFKCE